jgi:hypothetical protein
MARRALGACLIFLALIVPGAQAQDTSGDRQTRHANLMAYVELLRSDVRAQKVAIFTDLMGFSEQDDKVFWPIYREYDAELTAINDEKVQGIEQFATHYSTITDDLANTLAAKALDLEARRTALKQKYYTRLKTALSPRTAARFLQIENQLLMIIDLQIAASLPIIQ